MSGRPSEPPSRPRHQDSGHLARWPMGRDGARSRADDPATHLSGSQAAPRLRSVNELGGLCLDSVERVVERAPAHGQCNLCILCIFAGHPCRQCPWSGAAVFF